MIDTPTIETEKAVPFEYQPWPDQAYWPQIWEIVSPFYMLKRPSYGGIAYKLPSLRTHVCKGRRSYPYYVQYMYTNKGGKLSEWDKHVKGHGDWSIWAAADKTDKIVRWHILDLYVLRSMWHSHKLDDLHQVLHVENAPSFIALDLWRCPPEILIASSEVNLALSLEQRKLISMTAAIDPAEIGR